MHSGRQKKVRGKLTEGGYDAFLVSGISNIRYLTGFSGSTALLLFTKESSHLILDFRYITQAQEETHGVEIYRQKEGQVKAMAALLGKRSKAKVAFESEVVIHDFYRQMLEELPKAQFSPVKGWVEQLRMVKQAEEIKLITTAARIAINALRETLPKVKIGEREDVVAAELEYSMKKNGAERAAFDTIVASGFRASMPHARAGRKIITRRELVKLDFGAFAWGYNSDITRTFVMGPPSPKQKAVYGVVKKAQETALSVIKPGIRTSDIDKAARDVITKEGYGKAFGHNAGHGVGLDIHEAPRLSAQDETVVQEGMVFTVEPGIYLPDWGGVRIEDTVVATANGCKILTPYDKELRELG